MPLNIKNERVERLVEEVATDRYSDLVNFMEREIWPRIPKRQLGHGPSRRERERILGYGKRGV